jgi:hypothetical protein
VGRRFDARGCDRSAGLFPGRVVATGIGEHRIAEVEYAGPDGLGKTEPFEHNKGQVRPGYRFRIRVWPDERRAVFDEGDKHTAPIVVGNVFTLLGATATVLVSCGTTAYGVVREDGGSVGRGLCVRGWFAQEG